MHVRFATTGSAEDDVGRPSYSPGIRALELLALAGAAAGGLTFALPATAVGFTLAIVLGFRGAYGIGILRIVRWLIGRPNLGAGRQPVWVAVVVAVCGVVCWIGARDELGTGLVLIPAVLPFALLWDAAAAILFPIKRWPKADPGAAAA